MRARFIFFLQVSAIVLGVAWVYGPALQGDWIWDDTAEVSRNSVLREPIGVLRQIWLAPVGTDYFPLKTTVQWAEWHLWGDHRLGYHLTSVALHLLSALLFWRLLRLLFAVGGGPAGTLGPWLGGLIFAIHPLAVESVAWIAELKNTLSLPFLLLAMICYVEFDAIRTGGARGGVRRSPAMADPPRAGLSGGAAQRVGDNALHRYWGSIGLFLAAMLSKSSVVMFPVVLLLYAWWRRGRITRREVGASAPFFALSLGLGLVTLWFQLHRAIGYDLGIGGGLTRVAAAGLAIAFYVGKFLWPVGLQLIYPRWQLTPLSPVTFLPWIAILAGVGWLWSRRDQGEAPGWARTALFGLGCFVANLAPVLGLVPMSYLRQSWVADHFVYVPILGLIGLAAAGIARAADRWSPDPRLGAPLACLVTLACLALVSIGHRSASVFRNAEEVWNRTLQGNPSSWTAHYDLGLILFAAGRLPEAIRHDREVLRLNPDYAEADYNLGIALAGVGRTAEAIVQYEEALRIKPNYAEAHNNLGIAFGQTGRTTEAIAQFEEALREKPKFADAQFNLALTLHLVGRTQEAETELKKAANLRTEAGPAAGSSPAPDSAR